MTHAALFCALCKKNAGGFTTLGSLQGAVPFTVCPPRLPEGSFRQSYVVSIRAHLVDYARDEIAMQTSGLLRRVALLLVACVDFFFWLLATDRCVFVNNLLVSTNMYVADPPVDGPVELSKALASAFPGHAVVWRSLDKRSTPRLLSALRPHCFPVFSRLINYLDPSMPRIWSRSACLSDAKNFAALSGVSRAELRKVTQGLVSLHDAVLGAAKAASPYEFSTLTCSAPEREPGLCARLEELYTSLYIEKYSRSNPQYRAPFFAAVISRGVWDVVVARRRSDGVVDGFMAVYQVNGMLTAPAVGYDKALDRSAVPLYTCLQFWAMLEARSRGVSLNMSGGVAKYKQHRGAESVVEHQCVYAAHLRWHQRLFWAALAACSGVAERAIERKYAKDKVQ